MFKRGGVWWTCIRYKGKRYQKSLETTDKGVAKTIEAKIRTEIVEGKYFEKPVNVLKNFKDMMQKFMKEHAPNVSVNTQKSYSSYLNNLIPFFGDITLDSITPKSVYRYKIHRKEKGVKPSTINRELSMLSKAFNLAVKEWEWMDENPLSKVPKERENNERDRWLNSNDEIRLLEHSPEWLRDIIIFAINTGLRQGELRLLQWNRVNLINKTILIQETKNGKPKTIPLNQITLDILLKKWKSRNLNSDYVFVNKVGHVIDRHNLRRAFNSVLKKTGIKDFHFHDLRHTFATRLAQKGVDIYKISKLLGHLDLRMTQRYSHHCPESLRDSVMILENDYNLTTVGSIERVDESHKSLSLLVGVAGFEPTTS